MRPPLRLTDLIDTGSLLLFTLEDPMLLVRVKNELPCTQKADVVAATATRATQAAEQLSLMFLMITMEGM